MTESKYRNIQTELDGILFASKAEARRYAELKLLERAGEIRDLRPHPIFRLQRGFRDGSGKWRRPITYEADFQYLEDGRFVVEDVKGHRTAAFNIKVKLFLFRYPNCDFRIVSV